MSSPVPSDVHVNTPLTNISIAYLQSQESFVASRVFPNIPVAKQSDRYYTYDRGEFNRDEMEKRAPATESAGGDYTVDNTPSYYCDVWALHRDIPDRVRANEDSVLNSDRDATNFLSHKALIKKERIWAANYFSTSVWTNEVLGSALTGLWSADAGTPIEDIRSGIRTMLEDTGKEANKLTLGKKVYDDLLDHPDLVDRIKYGQTPGAPAMANTQILAKIFEVDEVLVMKAIYNTAKEGQTASHSFIGGKHALLTYSPPAPGLLVPSAGYTFSWTGLLGGGAGGGQVSKMRMDLRKADRIELEMAFDLKLVAADLGYFFNTVVA
jgi:hypothetical protein